MIVLNDTIIKDLIQFLEHCESKYMYTIIIVCSQILVRYFPSQAMAGIFLQLWSNRYNMIHCTVAAILSLMKPDYSRPYFSDSHNKVTTYNHISVFNHDDQCQATGIKARLFPALATRLLVLYSGFQLVLENRCNS